MAELEEAKAAREEDRLARVKLEKQLQELKAQKSQSQRMTAVASTPVIAVAETPGTHASASSYGSRGSASSSVQARYFELKELAEDLATAEENARLKKDNLLMRKAICGE